MPISNIQPTYETMHRAAAPGMPVGSGRNDVQSFTVAATFDIQLGAAVERVGDRQCKPLSPGGKYIGIAVSTQAVSSGVGFGPYGPIYSPFDNVPVTAVGAWWGLADKALTEGSALNWNSTTLRWTDAAASGATPGVETDTAAAGGGALIQLRLRRKP